MIKIKNGIINTFIITCFVSKILYYYFIMANNSRNSLKRFLVFVVVLVSFFDYDYDDDYDLDKGLVFYPSPRFSPRLSLRQFFDYDYDYDDDYVLKKSSTAFILVIVLVLVLVFVSFLIMTMIMIMFPNK